MPASYVYPAPRPLRETPIAASRYGRGLAIRVGLCVCVCAGTQAAATLTLQYGSNPDYPPYHWCQDRHVLTGASVALLQRVIPPGVQLQAVVYPWKRVLQTAEAGQLDIILPLRINAERARYLRFGKQPAFENPIAVFTRKDSSLRYQSWESLKPYRGGVSLGDVFGDGFDEYLARQLSVEMAPNMESNFKKLALGRIDYFITGRYVGLAYLRKTGLYRQLHDMPIAVSSSKIYLGFGPRVPDSLIDSTDAALSRMAASGETRALLDKWLARYANSQDSGCF